MGIGKREAEIGKSRARHGHGFGAGFMLPALPIPGSAGARS